MAYLTDIFDSGQRVGGQDSSDSLPPMSRNPGDPLPSPKLRVFKHSANLVEVERMGLLKELLSCLELVEPTLASIEQQFEADGAELKELAAQEQLVLEQATVARERAKAMEEQAEAEAEKRRQGEWIREKAERAQEEMEARMMQQGD